MKLLALSVVLVAAGVAWWSLRPEPLFEFEGVRVPWRPHL